jgi:hypothetical protein
MALDPSNPSLEAFVGAMTLGVDRLGASVIGAFEEAGLRPILLKGATLRDWLYQDGAARRYGDVDLIVRPDQWTQAQDVLKSLGFFELLEYRHPTIDPMSSWPWRSPEGDVDLHATFFGIEVPPEDAWEVLQRNVVPFKLAGVEVQALSLAGRAMHVALHAAQHGRQDDDTQEDLRRALAQGDDRLWWEAAGLATKLGATGAMRAGLEMNSLGAVLAERLDLDPGATATASLRVDGIPLSESFEALRTARGLRARFFLLFRLVFPEPDFMYWRLPLARGGRLGMAAAYLSRIWYLARNTPAGYLAYRRARRGRAA